MKKVDPPKVSKRDVDALTEDEAVRFFNALLACDFEFRCVLQVLLTTGLRRGECLGLQWADIDFQNGTLTVNRSTTYTPESGITVAAPKTAHSVRTIPVVGSTLSLLKQLQKQQEREHPATLLSGAFVFSRPDAPFEPRDPSAITRRMKRFVRSAGLPNVSPHDLRHPYVKHTTKIFSLRLMDFQAQAYPDARRKTRGACQLLRVGQSRSPVRPLCNRKQLSCLLPQSKMSWILYAISMRLSGYTSTRSISSSASSVVSVSASKIALDASLRLSCRACSSCFCFACANTAA